MVFSSPVFLFLFLPLTLVFTLVFRARKAQNLILLLASLLFYAWGETIYVLIMLASIVMNYLFGVLIDSTEGKRKRNRALGLGVFFNLALLAFFKYANFLTTQANIVLEGMEVPTIELANVHLPIGISFFTFQSISYIVDVHRRQVQAQHNPLDLALYISLFPQLIAGPIVRYKDVAQQLMGRKLDVALFSSGVRRFIIGLAKKVIIANTAAYVADGIFDLPPGQLPAQVAWLGILCYTLQIYFDFSGYSDMAIGLGRMFGFRFLENFNFPYISRSIREFWQRWHISLSNWFRDYLYIPLGGNRGGAMRTYRNLFLVFLLTGLWHGASWNFIVWGLVHGAFLILERIGLGQLLERSWRPIAHLYTLLVVVLAWVFFRVEDLAMAWSYVRSMFGANIGVTHRYHADSFLDREIVLILLLGVLFSMPVRNTLLRWTGKILGGNYAVLQVLQYLALVLLFLTSCMYLASGTYNPFIYFRF